MGKAIGDLIDRIVGVVTALKGVKAKVGSQAEVPPAAPMVETPSEEDFDHAKRLTEELKGLATTLEAEVAKEAKVPDAAQLSGDTKSKTATTKAT